MIGIRYRYDVTGCTVNTFKNAFQLNWNRKLLIYVSCVSCVSFELVGVIWRIAYSDELCGWHCWPQWNRRIRCLEGALHPTQQISGPKKHSEFLQQRRWYMYLKCILATCRQSSFTLNSWSDDVETDLSWDSTKCINNNTKDMMIAKKMPKLAITLNHHSNFGGEWWKVIGIPTSSQTLEDASPCPLGLIIPVL